MMLGRRLGVSVEEGVRGRNACGIKQNTNSCRDHHKLRTKLSLMRY